MKKSLFILCTLVLSSSIGLAQKIKHEGAKVKYLRIPNYVFDKEVNTYKIDITDYGYQLENIGLNANNLAAKAKMDALSRVTGEAEIVIKLRFDGYGTMEPEMNQHVKDGVTKYALIYKYQLPMSYEIYVNGSRVGSTRVKDVDMNKPTFTYSTGYHESSSKAWAYWRNTGRSKLKNQIKNNFNAKYDMFLKQLRNDIDYKKTTHWVTILYPKTTKKEDFTEYEKHSMDALEILKSLEHGSDRSSLKNKLAPHVVYWKQQLEGADKNDKKQENLYMGSALNVAEAYYWMDDMPNAQAYYDMADEVKGKAVHKMELKKDIEKRTKDLEALAEAGIPVYTGVEPASLEELQSIAAAEEARRIAEEAEIAAKIEAERLKNAPVVEEKSGYIITRDEKRIDATFYLYKERTGDKEGKIFYMTEGAEDEIELTAANILEAKVGAYMYEVVKHKDAIGLGKEMSLMKILFQSEKITVYEEQHMNDDGDHLFTNVYFLKPGENYPTNSSSLTFEAAWKGRLAGYFSDCAALVKKIEAGDYPNSPETRVAIAADYSNTCN